MLYTSYSWHIKLYKKLADYAMHFYGLYIVLYDKPQVIPFTIKLYIPDTNRLAIDKMQEINYDY